MMKNFQRAAHLNQTEYFAVPRYETVAGKEVKLAPVVSHKGEDLDNGFMAFEQLSESHVMGTLFKKPTDS